MASPSTTLPGPPTYIYKIVPASPPLPSPLPESLPLSDLDARDGYIHASTSAQILGTLNAYFSSVPSVIILRIPYERVKERVRWEMAVGKRPEEKGGCWDTEGRMGGFPHIYETKSGELRLGREEVESVGTWNRGGERWGHQGWPFGGEDIPKEN
ncbi:Uncharacterized protein BP5553_07184 [Venustampulla echinocandica]|uniref:DUF952 domain-containing protein n=1 Tax=Venustampulla echinocandica TaxID=2656787 RepID=A0A370TIS5_9HELO|nr:Uncharacterized protein BP5553_07184 [Venustampulla echinocandica]RDL35253.1 Uncharacterized protein BP5553_07184 [Venustampulla echinocandica]